MKLKGDKSGRKGQLSVATEVNEFVIFAYEIVKTMEKLCFIVFNQSSIRILRFVWTGDFGEIAVS